MHFFAHQAVSLQRVLAHRGEFCLNRFVPTGQMLQDGRVALCSIHSGRREAFAHLRVDACAFAHFRVDAREAFAHFR